jgi:SIR2-like domain
MKVMKADNKKNQAVEFQRFILSLLKRLSMVEGKTILTENEMDNTQRNIMDAFAPSGLTEIDTPLAVRVRYGDILPVNIVSSLLGLIKAPNINSILLISNKNIRQKEELTEKVKSKFHPNRDINLVIWDMNDITKLSEKYPETSIMYQNNFNLKITNEALNKFENIDYLDKNRKYISNLSNAYKNDDLVLFIGAGVSVGEVKLPNNLYGEIEEDPGLPDWNLLIKKLIRIFFHKHYKGTISIEELDRFSSAKFNEFSPLILGRFIREVLGDRFYYQLRQALYYGYQKKIREYSSIYSISRLCVPSRSRRGVSAVVTYNYDDLLEFYLDNAEVEYNSIYTPYEYPSTNELPIYHVHGFLPDSKQQITNEMKESIVFSEYEYHLQYEKTTSWQNITQLSLLREKTALFIGLSMNDPNIRRLLDVATSYSKTQRHYAILRDEWADDKHPHISNIFRNMHEKTFEKLGVNIIWIKDFSEIQQIVKSLKSNEYSLSI